jgi:hypothetical protein
MKLEKGNIMRFKMLTVASMMMIAFWDIVLCIPETSIYLNETTWRYISEGCCYLQENFCAGICKKKKKC